MFTGAPQRYHLNLTRNTTGMKIHIMGASCAGSTTLGHALAEHCEFQYFDTDDYFWLPTHVPYTQRRTFNERNELLKADLQKQTALVVGGSLINWGLEWQSYFNLVVFLYVPPQIRIQRLQDREIQRYGAAIFDDFERAARYQQFLTWATGYDDNSTTGRNINAHRNWLNLVQCPVLEINGDTTVAQRVDLIEKELSSL
jgi:adenylate kinase family enzyme